MVVDLQGEDKDKTVNRQGTGRGGSLAS